MNPMEIIFDNAEVPEPRVSEDTMRSLISTRIADAQIKIYDLTGGGDHYQVEVISQEFVGKSPVARHRMVYDALKGVLSDGALHALALSTKVPPA
jgi:stress-induced morphogen